MPETEIEVEARVELGIGVVRVPTTSVRTSFPASRRSETKSRTESLCVASAKLTLPGATKENDIPATASDARIPPAFRETGAIFIRQLQMRMLPIFYGLQFRKETLRIGMLRYPLQAC